MIVLFTFPYTHTYICCCFLIIWAIFSFKNLLQWFSKIVRTHCTLTVKSTNHPTNHKKTQILLVMEELHENFSLVRTELSVLKNPPWPVFSWMINSALLLHFYTVQMKNVFWAVFPSATRQVKEKVD